MARIQVWDEDQARRELNKRLQHSEDARHSVEYKWEENERTIYNTNGQGSTPQLSGALSSSSDLGLDGVDNSNSEIQVPYTFKNLRFIHAQMSANPPSVVVRPTSNDQDDRKKADAADRLVRHALRTLRLQEKVDQSSLHTLVYGTGFMKLLWDADAGDIIEWDPETGEVLLEGDLHVTTPSPWDIYLDPDARCWDDVRYVFERIWMPYEEALFRFGEDKKEILEQIRNTRGPRSSTPGSNTALQDDHYDSVEIFHYWEKGLPVNGYLGRFGICTKSGAILESVRPNPFRFVAAGAVSKIDSDDNLSDEEKEEKIRRLPRKARLPYHVLTDIDVPNQIWGKSFIEYVSVLQDTMNRLDSSTLDNIQAHGVARMVLPEGAEISDDSITNSPWDIVKMTGSQPPHFVSAPRIMPEVAGLRDRMKIGVDDISGVNESMFGQQSREQSGFSMQYATNQGNMIRRRLFNKYVIFVEDIYKTYLNIIRKHWETSRVVKVLGSEKALEAVEIKGADIDGGFDLVVEYGASLSLDPMTRREEIMSLQPLFQEAGVPPRVSLKMMKLNELEGMYDMMQMAEDRQSELFQEMIATGVYIQPEDMQDHENMIAYGLNYFMTTEFKYLDENSKMLCKQHITERAQVAAQEAQGSMPGAPAPGNIPGAPMAPGPAGAPGQVPAGPEMSPEQAPAPELPPQ